MTNRTEGLPTSVAPVDRTLEGESRELAVVPQTASVFGTDDPRAIVQRTADIAGPLAAFIDAQHMTATIDDRKYVLIEGWSFLGSMLGVFPRTVEVRRLTEEFDGAEGFEASVELITRDGSVVGGAIAECSRAERNWKRSDNYALKSMAQTRATGKAYRMVFGFVMKAAGYEATPAEEMPRDGTEPKAAAKASPPQTREAATDERSGGFQNVGAFLTQVRDDLHLNAGAIRNIIGLDTGARPEAFLDYEGGLDALYAHLVETAPEREEAPAS